MAHHDARIRNWKQAIGKGSRLRDDMAGLVELPVLDRIKAL